MHLLPARVIAVKNRVDVKNEINYFYLCVFTITVLFLSAFLFKLHRINSNVLGVKTKSVTNKTELAKQVNFWGGFTSQFPKYYEAWIELYGLTGESSYLIKAKEIDPNR